MLYETYPNNHKIQKTMKKFYFLFLMTLLTSTVTMQAQTFSQMSEKKRNAELIKIARKLYHEPLFADYYKKYGDNGKPKVVVRTIPLGIKQQDGKDHDLGNIVYDVYFYTKKEFSEKLTLVAARVIFSDKQGKPFSIVFGNKKIYSIVDHPNLLNKYKYRSK